MLHGTHHVGQVIKVDPAGQDPAEGGGRRISRRQTRIVVRDGPGQVPAQPGLNPRRITVGPPVLVDQQAPQIRQKQLAASGGQVVDVKVIVSSHDVILARRKFEDGRLWTRRSERISGPRTPSRGRTGRAGSNTAVDHITVLDQALAQLPADVRSGRILVRTDGAGFSHAFLEHLVTQPDGRALEYSVGYAVT
jgi:hypothetical protein